MLLLVGISLKEQDSIMLMIWRMMGRMYGLMLLHDDALMGGSLILIGSHVDFIAMMNVIITCSLLYNSLIKLFYIQ